MEKRKRKVGSPDKRLSPQSRLVARSLINNLYHSPTKKGRRASAMLLAANRLGLGTQQYLICDFIMYSLQHDPAYSGEWEAIESAWNGTCPGDGMTGGRDIGVRAGFFLHMASSELELGMKRGILSESVIYALSNHPAYAARLQEVGTLADEIEKESTAGE